MAKHDKYSPKLLPEDPDLSVIGANLAAQLLGVDIGTLYLWVRNGRVKPTTRIGERLVFKWSLNDLEELKSRLVPRQPK